MQSSFDIAIRPYNPNAKDVYQEPLCTFTRKLYASQGYLDKYGAPQTVEGLQGHQLIGMFTHNPNAGNDPLVDPSWLREAVWKMECRLFDRQLPGTGNPLCPGGKRHYRRCQGIVDYPRVWPAQCLA